MTQSHRLFLRSVPKSVPQGFRETNDAPGEVAQGAVVVREVGHAVSSSV